MSRCLCALSFTIILLLRLDLTTKTWSPLNDYPLTTDFLNGMSSWDIGGGIARFFGGREGQDSATRSTVIVDFDVAMNEWRVDPMTLDKGHAYGGIVFLDECKEKESVFAE